MCATSPGSATCAAVEAVRAQVAAAMAGRRAEVLLETEQGMLMIKGNDLHVSRLMLDKGEVDVDGKIDSLTYSESAGYGAKGESLFARLFK